MDWDLGHFERQAVQLLPVAELVVDTVAPRPGEVVVDLGCGSGNAALIAAQRGARVTGVDPSARLLEVAHADAMSAGLDATFVVGDAAAMPVPDGSVDAIVSVFGVIFAPDAAAAAAEMARVLRPGGRIVLTAWLREGALAAVAQLRRDVVAEVSGGSAAGAPFAWHDAEALAALLAPHGFSVEVHGASVAFMAASPEAYADGQLADHPLWVEARDVLEPAGRWEGIRADLVQLLSRANEDPAAFRITSHYVVAVARPH